MKFIKIQNNGLLDEKLIPLMGDTTKRNDSFKIGQFGTGLKYALAFIIRNKIGFRLFVGTREVSITSSNEKISNQEFDVIYIGGERTSITAQMGYDWTHWMILREIWCNALDEGGENKSIVSLESQIEGEENKTTFYIEYNLDFAKVWQNWSNYFIQDFEPIYDSEKFSLYPGGETLRIYKRGVLIHEATAKMKTVFSYDIKNASINELREFRGSASTEIADCISQIEDPRIITYFLENCTEENYEGKMVDYDWFLNEKFKNSWKDTIGDAKIIHKEALSNLQAKGVKIDTSRLLVVPEKLYKALTKYFDGIGLLRSSGKLNEFYEIHDNDLNLKIKQALAILETCGYFIDPELTFTYGVFGDRTIHAQIHIDKKEVLISEKMKDKSMFDTVAMLIEENEHYKTGMEDETREFQQHFIDLYTKQLLDKNEVKL